VPDQEQRVATLRRNRARALRREATNYERVLWRGLRNRQLGGFRFRRQHPLGPYVADFVCLEARLIVELDGEHHELRLSADARRDAWLLGQKFRVLRFSNRDLMRNLEGVLGTIAAELIAQR
jgi:very-short-patch-repair endonuclease